MFVVARARRPRSAFVVGALALCLVVGPAVALAHFDTGLYTHEDCPVSDGDRVDPINFVFTDWGTWDRAERDLEYHMDWTNDQGGPQVFVDHGNCYEMTTQRASTCFLGGFDCDRNHIRLHPIHFDDGLGWTTVGDAHHEDWVGAAQCPPFGGHAVDQNGTAGSGFDQGRNDLFFWMDGQPGHSGFYTWWGNTQNFEQCDGGFAGSDGATVRMTTHQTIH